MNRETEGRIRTLMMRDGAGLHWRHWESPATLRSSASLRSTRDCRGAVVGIHGIQSHSGWYTASCAHMASAGYDVCFLDRRGSGLNKHSRGDVTDYRVLVDDLCEFVASVRRRVGGVPVHLQAISWGAKLACAALILHPGLVDSLMLVGPGLIPMVDVSFGVKLHAAAALVLNPRKLFDIPLGDARLFTDNPERIAFIESDPLSLRKCSARFLYATRRLDRLVRRRARELRGPLLMMLAGRDRIVDNDAVRGLFERFSCRPKEVIICGQAAHTLEFEPDPKPVFDDMVKWLNTRSEAHG